MDELDYKLTITIILAIIVIGSIGMFYAINLEQPDSVATFGSFDYDIPPATITLTLLLQ